MSARVGEARGPGSGGPEARREAGGFGEYLEAARRAAGQQAAARAARRAAGGGEAPGAEAGASPAATLSRRRDQADGLDAGLSLRRRRLDGAERADVQRRAEAAPAGPWAAGPAGGGTASPGGPAAAYLAAAVEKLYLAVERRDRALGPELRLDLGGRLSVRLARGEKGVEVVFAGEPRLARLVEAELPAVLARLRQMGIAVWRAEVRPGPEAAPSGGAGAARAPGAAR